MYAFDQIYIEVGDEYWTLKVLVTILGCRWPSQAPNLILYQISVTNIDVYRYQKNCHQQICHQYIKTGFILSALVNLRRLNQNHSLDFDGSYETLLFGNVRIIPFREP